MRMRSDTRFGASRKDKTWLQEQEAGPPGAIAVTKGTGDKAHGIAVPSAGHLLL